MKSKMDGSRFIRKMTILIVVLLILLGGILLAVHSRTDRRTESSSVLTDMGELLVSSKEGYHSVKVYKKDKEIIVSAESESAFFDGAQFTVETSGEITAQDIEIIWLTIDGRSQQTKDNDYIIAEIKITENGKLICDQKINFAKKALDAIENVLNRTQPEN